MEHFDLEQNDIDKLETDSDKDINELNYIFSQDSDKCYLNFNEILYHYLKKNTSTHKLIDKYISLDKPKNFDIITINNEEDNIPPEIKKYKLDGKSLDDTNIITIPYKVLYDGDDQNTNSVFRYVSDCDNSYYKNIGKDSITNLYENNSTQGQENNCVAK